MYVIEEESCIILAASLKYFELLPARTALFAEASFALLACSSLANFAGIATGSSKQGWLTIAF